MKRRRGRLQSFGPSKWPLRQGRRIGGFGDSGRICENHEEDLWDGSGVRKQKSG